MCVCTPPECERETKIRGHKRTAGKEVASAGILGEGGIVLGVMWVEVGGEKDTDGRQV